MRRSTVSIFGVLLFALASVCATSRQAEQFSPELQEFRKNGTRDPLRNIAVLQMLPKSATHARIQTRMYDFEQARRQMQYELFVPTKYNASRPSPLMVTLHGLAVQPRDQIRFGYLTELAEERGYIVVAPMGYNDHGGYGVRGAGAGVRGAAAAAGRGAGAAGRGAGAVTFSSADDPANLGELSELDVMNVLALVRKEFNIDPNRIYLMGHSMGGGGTWHFGVKYPEIWAALAPVAPAFYTTPDELAKIQKMPVIVVQGDDDPFVSVNQTRQFVEKMKSLGMKYVYIEVPGGDHMTVITHSRENMTKIFDFFDAARRR
jgi:predicted peptidase